MAFIYYLHSIFIYLLNHVTVQYNKYKLFDFLFKLYAINVELCNLKNYELNQ